MDSMSCGVLGQLRLLGALLGASCIAASGAVAQQIPGSDPGSDSRTRFREIFCAVQAAHGSLYPYDRPCDRALHRLGGESAPTGKAVYLGPARVRLRIVVVPGILGECVARMATPFEDGIEPLRQRGWTVQSLRVSGRGDSAHNAKQIRDQLRALHLMPNEKLVLIGYSKGMSDILELLGSSDESVIPAGSSIVSLTGVVRGTPIADRASPAYRMFRRLPVPGCPAGPGNAVESLTREHRLRWLATHRLPVRLRYYSLPAFADLANISAVLRSSWRTLATIDPKNDGNVIASDSVIPGGSTLGYANSDHWALVLPFALKAPMRAKLFATKNEYPRVVLLESIARFFDELYLAENTIASASK